MENCNPRGVMKSQLKQYYTLIKPYWTSRENFVSWVLLIATLSLCLLAVRLSVYLNRLDADFYNFIEAKDTGKIAENLFQVFKVIGLLMVVNSIQTVLDSFVNFRWRQWMTKNFVHKWLNKRAYYFQAREVDNPDQRVSEDIREFSSRITFIVYIVFRNVASLFSFFIVLWNFSTPLTFSVVGRTFEIPHYLALFSIVYAILYNVLVTWIGKPIISLDYEQEKREADFRYALFRAKEYGEEIAFNKGEKFEERIFDLRFSFIKKNYYRLLKRNFYIDLTLYAHMSVSRILPTLLSLPLFFSGDISIGGLMQIGSAFSHVLHALCTLANSYQMFASVHATKNRLYGFLKSTEQAEIEPPNGIAYKEHPQNDISLSDVSIFTPSKEEIISGINFSVASGEKVLIMGRSGLGKTSILRALAKLWKHADGSITLPKDNVFFVPQKLYFPLATLKKCITYPEVAEDNTDNESLEQILKDVSLMHLSPMLEQEKDWMRFLSLGEQQRLNFARILFHKPNVLVLDEPTSFLDALNEIEMFELLRRELSEETTILTISHSEALKPYHDRCVILGQNEKILDRLLAQVSPL